MTAVPRADRPVLGIVLMLGFCVLAPFADAIAKLIGDAVPLAQLVASRFVVQAVLLVPLVWLIGGRMWLPVRLAVLVGLRTVLHIVGIALIFLALRYLPLADAIAIAYVMPFVALLLGHVFLGEAVGPARIGACVVGFLGTLLVLQPRFAEIGAVALLPLAVAVVFAVFMLMTRMIAHRIGALELQAVNGVIGALILVPLVALSEGTGWVELDPIWPRTSDLWWMLLLGVTGTIAHLLMTWALQHAPAATLAPMQYLEIPVAAAIGFWLFQELPSGLAVLGIAIVMGSGLFIIWREQRAARASAPPVPAGGPPAAG